MSIFNTSPKGLRVIGVALPLVVVAVLLLSSHSKLPEHFHIPDTVFTGLLPSSHTCPSPYDVSRPPITHDGQTCQDIPSNNVAFDMELCYRPQACNEFTLRIKRTNLTECLAAEGGPDPSLNPELSKWIRENRGPDAFLVRTDGAERFATVANAYEGNCSYAYDIRLKNPGTAYLQVWWTYSNYQAYSDADSSWPEQHLALMDSPIVLDICPSDCAPTPPARLIPNATMVNIPAPFAVDSSRPSCSRREPVRGAYLPAHPLDVLYPPITLPRGNNYPIVGRYNFMTEGCQWNHAGTRFSDRIQQCTSKKRKVLFAGDSHGRVTWDAMVHRLRGNQDVLTASNKAGSKNATIGETYFQFLWDPRGEIISKPSGCEEMIGDAEIVVVSVGAHLSGTARLPTSQYIQAIQTMFSTISSCPLPSNSSPRTLVYMTAPAAPPRTDEYVRKYSDHRTNVRLQHWSELATETALKAGWSVVDQFDLTLPHNLEPLHTDLAHYLETDAIDPIVDDVIGKIGICNEDDNQVGLDGVFEPDELA